MMSFEAETVARMPITHRLLRIVREISEHKGKEGLFKSQSPQVLATLRQVAMNEVSRHSARIAL